MASKVLPPGFRFHPTDVELVMYYLKRKILGRKLHFEAITEVDIYACNPDDLPAKTCMKSGDQKWYFFCPREKRYLKGERAKRSTPQGFWKTTGNDRPVLYNGECAGKIKTLIFHRGKAPKGERTDWVMHEYRITEQGLGEKENEQDTFVLCRIFQKEGLGPRNGAQYGAPFKEEDWDEEVDVALPSEILLTVTADPKNQNPSAVECVSSVPQSSAIVSFSEAAPSDTVQELPHHPDENVVTVGADELADDDLLMFGLFADEILNAPDQNVGNEELGRAVSESNCEAAAPDVNEIYNELDDLCNFHGLIGLNGSECTQHEQPLYSPLAIEFHESLAGSYMELSDLDNPLLFTEQLSFVPVTDEVAPSSEGTNLFDSNQSSNVVVAPIAEVAPLPDGTHLFDGYPALFFQEMRRGDSSVYDASPSAGFQDPTSHPLKRRRQEK